MGSGLCKDSSVRPFPEAPSGTEGVSRVFLCRSRGAALSLDPPPAVSLELSSGFLIATPSTGAASAAFSQQLLLPLKDIIGAQNIKFGIGLDGRWVHFGVYEYPRRRKNRGRQTHVFRVAGGTREQNLELADAWTARISTAVHAPCPGARGPSMPRRLYVLANPHSGSGKALHIFQRDVRPLFLEANVDAKLVITEREGHATELVQTLAVDEWDGLVIVSGDGLLYEVVNGLMLRPDAAAVLARLPIGIIPGGSGNGLAATLCYEEGEPFRDWVVTRTLAAAAPASLVPLPLIRVSSAEGRSSAFLSLSWGFLADIDIESEKFRKTLGPARFTVGALLKLANIKFYTGRVSWLPAEDVSGVFGADGRPKAVGKSLRRRRVDRSVSESEPGRVTQREQHVNLSLSVSQLSGPPDRSDSGSPSYLDADTPAMYKVEFPRSSARRPRTALNPHPSRTDLAEPLPSSWVTQEDSFLFVMVVFVSHLSAVLPFMPGLRLGDDVMYLTLVRERNITRRAALAMLMGFENAAHLSSDALEVHAVRGVRIETLGNGGTIAVDGELVETEQIQATTSDFSARVFSRKQPI